MNVASVGRAVGKQRRVVGSSPIVHMKRQQRTERVAVALVGDAGVPPRLLPLDLAR